MKIIWNYVVKIFNFLKKYAAGVLLALGGAEGAPRATTYLHTLKILEIQMPEQ